MENPINPEKVREIEVASNELYRLLNVQMEEWKTYLKSLLPKDSVAIPLVEGIQIAVAQVKPGTIDDGGDQKPTIQAVYSIPDGLIDFAKSLNSSDEFTKALLEDGIEVEDAPVIQPS